MSHGELRNDKNCENCNSYVPERYCSRCGQENITTRQPFYFLITHFIEDFLHYDSSFWHTIKNLFLKPGALTIEYLSGKRQSSVNPVKLYIFVSFITFFILAILPSGEITVSPTNSELKVEEHEKEVTQVDLYSEDEFSRLESDERYKSSFGQYVLKPLNEKNKEIRAKHMSAEEFSDRFLKNFVSLIPKTLFLYMPFFAFLLWLFYDKKKWWFFDHGIFTLHYFSMLLLVTTIMSVISYVFNLLHDGFFGFMSGIIKLFLFFYTIVYFYLALRKIYKQSRIKTIIKGTLLLWINSFFILIILAGLLIYSFYKI
jgi:hypothetical protein